MHINSSDKLTTLLISANSNDNISLGNLSDENYELDLDDEFNQTGVTRLTQILAILGVCICVIGIIGNFLSIIVLTRKSMKKLSTYSYLLGLSICDEISLTLTVIILLHYASPTRIILSQSLSSKHKILLIYIYPIVASTQALSVWITLAFTVDRYLYVCHPYYGRLYCTRKRACFVLIALYLLAAIYSIPQFLERTYVVIDVVGTKHVFQNYTSFGRNPYFIYIYHLFIYCLFVCFIPITIIVVLNGFLVFDIIKSNKRHRELSLTYKMSIKTTYSNTCKKKSSAEKNIRLFKPSKIIILSCFKPKEEEGITTTEVENSNITEPLNSNMNIANSMSGENNFLDKHLKNDVTIMLIGLIVVFLICQSPSSILRLITFKNLSIYFQPIYYSSLDVSNFLIVTNSTLNCVLYVMLGKKFRKELFNSFFSKCFPKHRHRNNQF